MSGPAAGDPSSVGVIINGLAYQCLVAWTDALRLVLPGTEFTRLQIEAERAGNVDDVVLTRRDGSGQFTQVKWAANDVSAIDEKYLVVPHKKGSVPLLGKFCASYRALNVPGRPVQMRLFSTRHLDKTHPLLGAVDGRTSLLLAVSGDHPDPRERAHLQRWAAAVEVPFEELVEALQHLHFHGGRQLATERAWACDLMLAAGLVYDDDALDRAVASVAAWIADGRREVFPADVPELIDRQRLRSQDPWGLVVVEAIDAVPHAEDADDHLDWRGLYAEDVGAGQRIEPVDPTGWQQMKADLRALSASLIARGSRRVLLRGAFRQATAFTLGFQLSDVKGFELRYDAKGMHGRADQLWLSRTERAPIDPLSCRIDELGQGSDLAVVVSIARDARSEVLDHLRAQHTPVARLLTVEPAAGPDPQAVAHPQAGRTLVTKVRDAVHTELCGRSRDAERIHLFLAGPNGVALLLGHYWNRLRTTVVHEHLGPGRGYLPAFTVEA